MFNNSHNIHRLEEGVGVGKGWEKRRGKFWP